MTCIGFYAGDPVWSGNVAITSSLINSFVFGVFMHVNPSAGKTTLILLTGKAYTYCTNTARALAFTPSFLVCESVGLLSLAPFLEGTN